MTYSLRVGSVSLGNHIDQFCASTSYSHDMEWLSRIKGGGKLQIKHTQNQTNQIYEDITSFKTDFERSISTF